MHLLEPRVSIDSVPEPRLDHYATPDSPRAIVLVLHGGQEHSEEPVRDRHASWWRMALMARSLRGFAVERDLAVVLLQYRVRGWNGPVDPAPVRDARWALDRLTTAHPGVPVILLGHSMGGRTACHAAQDPHVLGVVALAPWLPDGEPTTGMTGRHLRVMHGTRDKWTSAHRSQDYVERCQRVAASASWCSLPGAGHFMLRRVSTWRRFVEDSVEEILDIAASHEGASSKGSA